MSDAPTNPPAARQRAWGALGAAMAGVWAADGVPGPSVWWLGGAMAALALGALVPARWWWLAAVCAVFGVSGGWATLRFDEPSPRRADRVLPDERVATLRGTVLSEPKQITRPTGPGAPGAWRGDAAWFPLRAERAADDSGGTAVTGEVRVTISMADAAVLGIRAGDRISARGLFHHGGIPSNPGEPDWRRFANERGRAGSLSVTDASLISVQGEAWWAGPARWRTAARARALAALGVDADGSGVVGALVLGERDDSFEGVYRVFQRAGVAHVLAVSGFHLALLCGMVAVVVRATGERGRLESVAVLGVAALMVLAVPVASPVLRAAVLVAAMWLGDALGRRWDRLAVLGWTGLGLVVWRPSEAMSLGFLLSVGVTALLLFMGERERAGRWWLLERHRDRTAPKGALGAASWLGGWVWRALKLNAVCWLVSAPAIVAATGVVSPLAPLATVAIVPLATVLLAVGWVQALLGVVWPEMASRTVGVVDTMGSWMGGMANWFDGLPGSSAVVGGVGWVWAAAATVVILGLLFRPGHRRMYAALLGASVAYAVAANATAGRVSGIRADMLDVGDGTAVIIRSGTDTLLWDCGSLHRAVGQRVADAARELGVPRVREAVVTHANLDHFNALPEVAERLGLRRVYVSTALMNSRGGAWGQVRELLEARGVEIAGVAAGDEIVVGSLRGEVLWPPAETGERWLGNDGSLVVRFWIDTPMGERALVMTGDIQAGGVAGLEARGVDVRAAVIEAPHHGSANDAGVSLVDRAGPSAVLQSSGPGRVNLPAWAGVRARTAWLSTAEGGAVWARIRPDGRVEVGTYRDVE